MKDVIHTGLLILQCLLLCLTFNPGGMAQVSPSAYNFPNHHLPWYTLESDHFKVHFQKGNSRSARVAVRIAEEIYPLITDLYDTEPDSKVDIVLKDREDQANGAAYFFDNQINIGIPALDTPFRGTHYWLRNVITHEFTHIISLKAAMKRSRSIPAFYLQWLSYEDVRRPDILYGYPKGIFSYPLASISVPAWFAEGTAQYMLKDLNYDHWDSHRDMMLRTALLTNTFLSFTEMGNFSSKNGLEREQIYNQGFAFVSYLAESYGDSILPKIARTFSRRGVYDAGQALEKATGTHGKDLFRDFINTQKGYYEQALSDLKTYSYSSLEEDGYLNLYPKYSPDGTAFAYLSNKSNGNLQLFIRQTNDNSNSAFSPDSNSFSNSSAKQGLNSPADEAVVKKVHSSYSFSDDGNSIAFSRRTLNSYGEQYDKLYLYNIETKQIKELSSEERVSAPSFRPGSKQIAAIKHSDGTTNIVLLSPSSDSLEYITSYTHGEQVFTPVWHPDGDKIYFAFADKHNRNIASWNTHTGNITPLLSDNRIDYRDPFIDSAGQYLYYSADPDGIFNIYRIPLQDANPIPQKMTSVSGGAFMPHTGSNDILLFSEYTNNGYKLSAASLSGATGNSGSYKISRRSSDDSITTVPLYSGINHYPDSLLERVDDDSTVDFPVPKTGYSEQLELYSHKKSYTDFSFYPVIRLDNYSKPNGGNGQLIRSGKIGDLGENIIRDLKIGTYFFSREVTDKLSISGGALAGVGSLPAAGIGDFFSPDRLTDLDRDLFLITEYQGLPFIKKRWSPTISVELYNLRRNVSNGLQIEEFPCTSCLPDTSSVDIAYNIWEADLFLRSKINSFSLLEVGIGYSPYRVQSEAFYSRELQQLIPSSSSEYFRGTMFTAAYIFERFRSYRHANIAPVGFQSSLRYNYEPGKLLSDYEIEDGGLSPVYKAYYNHSVETSLRYGFPVADRKIAQIYTRFFTYFNNPDDTFYLDYTGGITGMRSYPFFALGGSTTGMAQVSYIFPLMTNLHEQVGPHTLDKLFIRVFGEAGNGWRSPLNIGNNIKTGIGAELRFAFNSYYLFPLKFFVSGAYGFNKFEITLPETFIMESNDKRVSYGKDFIFHFGLTFDFNLFNND